MLAKPTNSKHIVSWVPYTVGNHIQKFALVRPGAVHLFERRIPDPRFPVFRSRDQELTVWGDSTSHMQSFTLCAEKSFLNSCASRDIKLNQPNTVIS